MKKMCVNERDEKDKYEWKRWA